MVTFICLLLVSLRLFFFQLYGRDEEGALARVINQQFLSP